MQFLSKIYNVMKIGSDWIEKVFKFITAVLMLLCSFTVFLQVINRYILVKQTLFPWKSISWTDELARLLMVTLAYLAMGLCYKHGQLSRADMVFSRLKGIPKKVLYYIEFAMICVFVVSCIKWGVSFALANKIFRTESLFIPGNILYMIPVIGFVLMLYQVLTEFVGVVSGNIEPFESIVMNTEEEKEID